MPLCDSIKGIFSASREEEIILSQFSKEKLEVPHRIDLRMGTAASKPEPNAPSHAAASWFYFLLIAAGFFLRLRLAWLTFLNPDEALHYFLAHQPSLKLAYQASLTTAHPPLMILFLHYWCLLGRSEFFLRLPFVIAGTLFCWVMFLWIRRVASGSAACFGLAMFLFAPSLISLSAEIRQYSFLLLFCACCLYWMERALQNDGQNSVRWILLSAGCLYLALLTHYSAMIFAATVGVYGLLSLARKKWPARSTAAWILGQVGALAICAFLYKSQISKLRESGMPSEIAATWLRNSIFQGQNHLATFAWSNTLRLFRYFFSQGTVGVIGFTLFVFAVVALIWHDKSREPKSQRRLAILLVLPLLITLSLAIAGVYPYGGTRHDVVLVVFAISGIAVGFDRLPLGGPGAMTKLVKIMLLASAMLICNFYPAPSGPYIRPRNQRRELMQQAVSSIKFLPLGSVLFTDAQGSMVLNYYLCDNATALSFTPQKPLLKLRCGQYYLLTSLAPQTGFDRATFPELLSKAIQENANETTLYLFQSGWIDDKEEDWLTELRGLGGNPRNFGPNVLLCPFRR
jgi:4-amino-4-deoxy-L-arabinose transferase-like glycosyltransferase